MSQVNPEESRQPDQALPPLETGVATAAQLLHGDTPPLLLDVREADERAFCNLGPGPHIPTGEIQFKWTSLPRDKHILVYCHHGMRSLAVTRFLREKGYNRVQSIQGGIDAWSRLVDPSIPRY